MEQLSQTVSSDLDDPEEWELPCSDGESACWDEVHRTEPVACRSIIKWGTMESTGYCPLSVVECGYTVGYEPATYETCGKTLPRPNVTLSDPSPVGSEGTKGNRSRNSSPAMSRKSSVDSWSGRPCEQRPFDDAGKAVVLGDASCHWEPGELAVSSTCPLKNVPNAPESENVCCGTTGCTESGLISVVGHGFAAGLVPDACVLPREVRLVQKRVKHA